MAVDLNYKVNLPSDIKDILDSDFWIFNNINAAMASFSLEPIKFHSSTFILVKKGSAIVDINLQKHNIKAPAYITVNANNYMHIKEVSPDLEAGVIVASKEFTEKIALFFRERHLSLSIFDSQVLMLSETLEYEFKNLFNSLQNLYNNKENPDRDQAILFLIISFFFANSYRILQAIPASNSEKTSAKGIANKFLELTQHNFKTNHNLEFYAQKLNISTKHLSRILKETTGYTASQWIDRYLLLEAKVMLRSSRLNVAQIAYQLNFATPSAFGKFFRKHTGISPKQFSKKPFS
ncbi:MAG: AraC family transcriptional regulator [Prevotella sp.]|nr:AraC family transcriptional regulator [Bacteroides sp.]MCM1366150.1 AraC family transcriptional regulator [Prevotella sp.]MCM1436785.1 AraC family transcriptional regulator [Prevotella sp.]